MKDCCNRGERIYQWVEFSNKTKHISSKCKHCLTFQGYVKHIEANYEQVLPTEKKKNSSELF